MPLLDRRRQWQSWGALDKSAGAPAGDSPELAQFLARIPAPSAPRKAALGTVIDGLVAAGIWPKIDVLHLEGAVDTATAHQNLKSSSHTISNHGATFSADAGYTGNGTSAWLETHFSPDAMSSPNFKADGSEGTLSAYITNNPSSGFTYAMQAGGNVSFLVVDFAGSIYCAIGGGGHNVTHGTAGGIGQSLITRRSSAANSIQIFKNSLAISVPGGAATVGISLGDVSILATGGGGGGHSDARVSASLIAGKLTDAEAITYMNLINGYMTHLGINAY